MASEMQKLQEQKQKWLTCDPVTLVSAAREQLYQEQQGEGPSVSPIEEVITRFEHQARAVIGGAPTFSSQQQQR